MWRRAMRNLHARNGDCLGGSPRKAPSSYGRRNSRRLGGQSVPLHRLPENFCGRGASLRNAAWKFSRQPMRAYIPAYDLHVPGSLSAALALLANDPGVWKPFAGGTDLMVLLEAAKLPHKRFLSVSKLDHLRGIEMS